MGWSIGYDINWKRDIGYGVPAYCDHPACNEEIDRGLPYVCGGEPYGGENGCGLYFCSKHLTSRHIQLDNEEAEESENLAEQDIDYRDRIYAQCCERCVLDQDAFDPKPDHPRWVEWKLTDESWADWRAENPEKVNAMLAEREKK